MGLFFRRSIKIGPIRLNLSTSGIGASVGVTGLRVGVRPSGRAYLHAGRYGLYYREELGNVFENESSTAIVHGQQSPHNVYMSAAATAVHTANPSEIVELLNASNRGLRSDYVVVGITIAIAVLGCPVFPLAFPIVALGVIAAIALRRWETRRRTLYLNYDLRDSSALGYAGLVEAINALATCRSFWYVDTERYLYDSVERKRQAGASSIVGRHRALVGEGLPKWMEANIPIPALQAQGKSFYFLPEGLLVSDWSGYGYIPYAAVNARSEQTSFIEESGVPSDATVVGKTWKHPNKDGTPDRRFASNYLIPICSYGILELHSANGLHILTQTSRQSAAREFCSSFDQCARKLDPKTRIHPWIEVNPEYGQNVSQAISGLIRQVPGLFLAAVRAVNRFLRLISGEGNDIIYGFLQVVTVTLSVSVLVVTVWLVVRFAFTVLLSA